MTKIDYSLAPPEFDDVVLVLQHSAETGKYGRDDWLHGKQFDKEQSIASIKRHLNDYRQGSLNDKDNNLHPMLMVACRALMQYTLDKRQASKSMNGHTTKVMEKWYDEAGGQASWSDPKGV